MRAQLLWAIALSFTGILLLWAGFCVPPIGVIDPSVLVALGEVFTFSGSIVGIDYHYKQKN